MSMPGYIEQALTKFSTSLPNLPNTHRTLGRYPPIEIIEKHWHTSVLHSCRRLSSPLAHSRPSKQKELKPLPKPSLISYTLTLSIPTSSLAFTPATCASTSTATPRISLKARQNRAPAASIFSAVQKSVSQQKNVGGAVGEDGNELRKLW
jgi:hypothetical protein